MKIAYVAFEDFNTESGVLKKVVKQMQYWIQNGHDVRLLVVSSQLDVWTGIGNIQVSIFQPNDDKGLLNYFQSWHPDVVYVRVPFKARHMWHVTKNIPTFFEINSDDLIEFKMFHKPNWLQSWKYKWVRKIIFERASGLVFVTNELASTHYGRGNDYRVISNGVSLTDYQIQDVPKNLTPRLVFMGTKGFPWHGVEKIITMAQHFQTWHFDMIGYNEEDIEGVKPPNVHFHGVLPRYAYEPILGKADVAIGTLSLYEKNMDEACPLKVREYLAYGLPVISGYHDSDFPNSIPFILQLPNISTNVEDNLDKIEKFVLCWMGKRVERKDVVHIDVAMKEEERLEFFKKFLSGDAK